MSSSEKQDEKIEELSAKIMRDVEAKLAIKRMLLEERLDELLRHSYGNGEVSSYSINRRIAELKTQLNTPAKLEGKEK